MLAQQDVSNIFVMKDCSLSDNELPTVVMIQEPSTKKIDTSIGLELKAPESTTEDVLMDIELLRSDIQAYLDQVVEIDTIDLSKLLEDVMIEFISKDNSEKTENVIVSFWLNYLNSIVDNIATDFCISNKGLIISNDIDSEFKVVKGHIPRNNDTKTSAHFCNLAYFKITSSIMCSYFNTQIITSDVKLRLGRLVTLSLDIFNSILKTQFISLDCFSSSVSFKKIVSDLMLQSGVLNIINSEIFCAKKKLSYLSSDLKIRSLFIGKCCLDIDDFMDIKNNFWVEVIDYLYPINKNSIKLYKNDTELENLILEDIINGVKVSCSISDDFTTTGSSLIYSIYAESIIGENINRDFSVLFGFNVVLNDVVDWGVSEDIYIRLQAKNTAFCSNEVSDSFKVTSANMLHSELISSINPISYSDITSSIYPQSTTFFYNKTYRIKLRNVKDFAGNILPEVIYEFTVEKKPN